MRLLCSLITSCFLFSLSAKESKSDYALRILMEGNERYANNKSIHPNQNEARREVLKDKQEPFAVILSCSDSRLASEIIFDRGLGDTFVVRVAGNVIGELELESIQYAVDQLGASLVMVLGHENCGAVKGVLEGGPAIQDMPLIARLIQPAIIQGKKRNKNGLLSEVIQINVLRVKKQLENDPFLQKFFEEGNLKVVGGYYHLESGKVTLIQ